MLLADYQICQQEFGTILAVFPGSMIAEWDGVFQAVTFSLRGGLAVWVREYALPDFPALVEMYKDFDPKRVAQGLPPPDTPRIANWLDCLQRKSRSLLAWDGARVIGHVILCPISKTSIEYTIFVHQSCRCQGLGERMTRLALDFAAQLGFTEVVLSTEMTNYPALALYRKLGFQMASVYGDECEMKLSLAASEDDLRTAA